MLFSLLAININSFELPGYEETRWLMFILIQYNTHLFPSSGHLF